MTDTPDRERDTLPAAVPFLLNSTLAAGLGLFVGGWTGAALAVALLAAAFGLFWLAGWSRRNGAAIAALKQAIRALLRPAVGLALLPLTVLMTIPVVAFHSAWLRIGHLLTTPRIAPARRAFGCLRRLASFLASGFTPHNLPGTALNLLLVLILGCVVIGIEVAFYAALAAVPIMLVTVMMVSIESSREPEQD